LNGLTALLALWYVRSAGECLLPMIRKQPERMPGFVFAVSIGIVLFALFAVFWMASYSR
jgi:hypothetical protein